MAARVRSDSYAVLLSMLYAGRGANNDVQHDQLRGAEVGDRQEDH